MSLFKQLGSKMLILSEKDVRRCLTMKDCLDINRKALMSVSGATAKAGGTGNVPSRLGLKGPPTTGSSDAAEDWTLFKPAAFYADNAASSSLMGLKVVSIRAQNPTKGLPLVPATVMVLDAETGIAKAIVSATYMTGARTAASSGIATQLLKPNVQHLVIFGAGLQAECHVDAIQTAIGKTIPKITIVNRSKERAVALQEQIHKDSQGATVCEVLLLKDTAAVENALSTADVVAATTNATEPLFTNGKCLPAGCHINGIGSYTPDMQEIPVDAVNRSQVLMDTGSAKVAGDIKHLFDDNNETQHPVTLIGDALGDVEAFQKSIDSQKSGYDCTFFKGVGTAIQDVMTADLVVTRAMELGIGTQVEMD